MTHERAYGRYLRYITTVYAKEEGERLEKKARGSRRRERLKN